MVDDGRVERRSSLLLAAQLRASGDPAVNVTVRNLSSTGALVEGPHLPGAKREIDLVRGALVASGSVAWAKPGRCGIRFDKPINLSAWLPGYNVSPGQQRVDAIQASVKAGEAHPSSGSGQPAAAPPDISHRVAEELGYVSRLIESVGDELATDRLAARHGQQLQNLDISIQLLRHLTDVLTAPDTAAAIKRIGMEELRRRLTRKML